MSNIDRNRGCIIRISPEGYRVIMYPDTPGVYFDEKGVRVKQEIAEASGFDVTEDTKTRAKQKLRANYDRAIGIRFAAMEQRMDEMLENNPNLINELEVREFGPGQFGVCDASGNAVSETTLTREEAVVLYAGLTGSDYKSDASDAPDQANPFMDMEAKEIRKLLKDAEVVVPVGLRMPKLAIFAFEQVTLEDDNDAEEPTEDTQEKDTDLL